MSWRGPGAGGGAPCGGRARPRGDGLEALHLEADVVDAAPVLAALDARHRVVPEVEDGQVESAVAQVVAPRPGAVDARDLLHAEHVDVELRGLVDGLGRERDVLDLRHDVSPLGADLSQSVARWVRARRANPGTASSAPRAPWRAGGRGGAGSA